MQPELAPIRNSQPPRRQERQAEMAHSEKTDDTSEDPISTASRFSLVRSEHWILGDPGTQRELGDHGGSGFFSDQGWQVAGRWPTLRRKRSGCFTSLSRSPLRLTARAERRSLPLRETEQGAWLARFFISSRISHQSPVRWAAPPLSRITGQGLDAEDEAAVRMEGLVHLVAEEGEVLQLRPQQRSRAGEGDRWIVHLTSFRLWSRPSFVKLQGRVEGCHRGADLHGTGDSADPLTEGSGENRSGTGNNPRKLHKIC